MTENDNGHSAARPNDDVREPDAYGQAAMLLVESLIHTLIARSVLTVDEAIEVVEVAADVKVEVAADLGDSPATLRKSLALLDAISTSLRHDVIRSDGDRRQE